VKNAIGSDGARRNAYIGDVVHIWVIGAMGDQEGGRVTERRCLCW
jgi:hypothetical protein